MFTLRDRHSTDYPGSAQHIFLSVLPEAEESMKDIQNIYQVVSNRKVCPAYYCLTIQAPELAYLVKPGQFIHIRVSGNFEPFFRRPFSVYRVQGQRVSILYEVVGKGTEILSGRRKGDRLDVLGPLGRAFTPPSARVRQVVFIGGGIGAAPFLLFAERIKSFKAEKLFLYGGRDRAHTFPLTAYKAAGFRCHVATDDGSVGVRGRITELFRHIKPSAETMIYTCGPKKMMAAVADFARAQGVGGEACLEEVMACGLGACLGCSTPTTEGYKTVCHDGPVFNLDEVIF